MTGGPYSAAPGGAAKASTPGRTLPLSARAALEEVTHLERRTDIYGALARTLLAGTRRPLIIVDWSDFELGREWAARQVRAA